MRTKKTMIDQLNASDDPKSLGFERYADDGRGNEYWVKKQGATTIRLNRFEDDDNVVWSDDIEGWENPR